ncbi:MAG TPA: DUF6798 domain-containing protein [Pirellulales bacterium]|jgi:hypothetical protein|nr:DUF6798 domain-containing protein [Pirellulales bacterium]
MLRSHRIAVAAWLETALVFGVFVLEGAWPVPDTNEAHYLGKALHYWDPTWCARDFFLNSADSHLTFYLSVGWLVRWLSFPAAAWAGRLATWALMAFGWRSLSHALLPRWGMAIVSAGLLAALSERCHMAGEWIIGGFEAKGLAFGLVFVALAQVVRGRWTLGWLLIGAASALHVLVGGWTAIALAGAWTMLGSQRPSLRSMLPGMLLGGVIALAGVIPGLQLTRHASPAVVAEANELYVYERLPHHLWPAKFPASFVERFLLLAAIWFALCAFTNSDARQNVIRRVVAASLMIAGAGWLISLAAPVWPAPVAGLLRFYWFRLSDAMLPLGAALVGTSWLWQCIATRRSWGIIATAVVVFGLIGHFAALTAARMKDPAPRADGPSKVIDYRAWRDVCRWVREHTPADALCLTPRSSQTFKWYAQRGEVVTWKDVPQDASELVAWWQRMEDIHGTGSIEEGSRFYGSLADTSVAHVARVARKYGVDYLVTTCDPPLALPCLYQNAVYAVYDLRDLRKRDVRGD